MSVERVGDINRRAGNCTAGGVKRAHRMAGLEHVPVRLHEFAEPNADERVAKEMLTVRLGAVWPEINRGAHQRGACRTVVSFHRVGHAVDDRAPKCLFTDFSNASRYARVRATRPARPCATDSIMIGCPPSRRLRLHLEAR